MTINEIISAVWEMPWYKVLVVAIVDDIIFFIKIWPVYAVLLGLAIYKLSMYKIYSHPSLPLWLKARRRIKVRWRLLRFKLYLLYKTKE